MKKRTLLIFALITVNAVVAANLTIKADEQQFIDAKNEANLKGNVVVQYDDITLTSQRAKGFLDPKSKKLKSATFMDKAYVYQVRKNKKSEVKADIIKMSLLPKFITAEGNTQTIVTENKQIQPLVTITANKQEYNINTKVMRSTGNVIVNYKDATSYSNEGVVKLDKNNDVEELQLLGEVKIRQKENNFYANRYIYKTASETATALGNVYSEMHNTDGSVITVKSEFQQYNRSKNTLTASKNVYITYKDYKAQGPKASVFPDPKTGKLNKIIFLGRSKIMQGGRTIEADKITMTMDPKNFDAVGNVRTFIPGVNTSTDF